MPNAIPLLEGTPGSGGYLVRDSFGPTLINAINRESAIAGLATIRQVNTKTEKYTVYMGRPTAAFVAEAAPKPVTGAEFTQAQVDMKKMATTVLYTEELLEDAAEDPTALISTDVRAAFADLADSHALGYNAAGVVSSQFNSSLAATTQTVELGSTADALAVAVSTAMGYIEGNGYRPSGIVLANDGRVYLRQARGAGDFAAMPLYTPGFQREPDEMYGLPIRYTTNLTPFASSPGAGKVVGLIGDFSQSILAMRKDIEISASTQATVDIGGTLHHLWQQNKTGVLWEARMGFMAHDINRAFCAIVNAS